MHVHIALHACLHACMRTVMRSEGTGRGTLHASSLCACMHDLAPPPSIQTLNKLIAMSSVVSCGHCRDQASAELHGLHADDGQKRRMMGILQRMHEQVGVRACMCMYL